MSEALYERYKDALRRGHVAAMRGRHAAAMEAYGEASEIAPDRALPLASIGSVLARMGRSAEALAAFEAALERSPEDEGALRGQADALAGMSDRVRAADAYDRLAAVLDGSGRLPDAADAARRALELAESRSRRAMMRTMVARLRDAAGDPAAAEALARASSVLEGHDLRVDADGPHALVAAAPGGSAASDPVDLPASELEPALPTPDPGPQPSPPFDPMAAIGAVEEAVEGDDQERARTLALAAAAGHRAAGQPSTAIDACYMALAGSPADPGLHLALAEVYLDQGWRALAVDKLLLLTRLADLADDAETRARICAIASARLPDEPRLAAACA